MSDYESRDRDRDNGRREEDGMIRQFMSNQQEVNVRLQQSIDKISSAISKSDAMQVELNNQRRCIDEVTSREAQTAERLAELRGTVSQNSTLVGIMQETKRTFIGAIIAICVTVAGGTGVWLVTTSGDAKALHQQQQATNKILEQLLTK